MMTVVKMEIFPRCWPFVRGIHRSPVNSPHKDQCRGSLMFSLICVSINGWVNNREAGDLRRHRAHYDVTVMIKSDTCPTGVLLFLLTLLVKHACCLDLGIEMDPAITASPRTKRLLWFDIHRQGTLARYNDERPFITACSVPKVAVIILRECVKKCPSVCTTMYHTIHITHIPKFIGISQWIYIYIYIYIYILP